MSCPSGITKEQLQQCCNAIEEICEQPDGDEMECERSIDPCGENFDPEDHCKPKCLGDATTNLERNHDDDDLEK